MKFSNETESLEIEVQEIPEEFKDVDLELLKKLYGAINRPIAVWDEQMNYHFANRAWRDFYKIEDLIPLKDTNHYEVFPNIPVRWVLKHKEIFESMKAYTCAKDSYIGRNNDTEYIWWTLIPIPHNGKKYLMCECGKYEYEKKEKEQRHFNLALWLNIGITVTQVIAYVFRENTTIYNIVLIIEDLFKKLM